jgi:hypothetical protein
MKFLAFQPYPRHSAHPHQIRYGDPPLRGGPRLASRRTPPAVAQPHKRLNYPPFLKRPTSPENRYGCYGCYGSKMGARKNPRPTSRCSRPLLWQYQRPGPVYSGSSPVQTRPNPTKPDQTGPNRTKPDHKSFSPPTGIFSLSHLLRR